MELEGTRNYACILQGLHKLTVGMQMLKTRYGIMINLTEQRLQQADLQARTETRNAAVHI
jgi:hypothetical protein